MWKEVQNQNFGQSKGENHPSSTNPKGNTQLQGCFNTCSEPGRFELRSLIPWVSRGMGSLSMTVNKTFVLDLRNLPNKSVVKTNKERDCWVG